MIEKFNDVKNADILVFKNYLLDPSWNDIKEKIVTVFSFLMVDIPFYLLDFIVGVFLVLMKVFEQVDLLEIYQNSIYKLSKDIWKNFAGGSGIQYGSLVWLLIAISSFYLFVSYLFNHRKFLDNIKHLLAVILIALSYFGTIDNLGGGVYVFQSIQNLADSSVSFISDMNFEVGDTTVTFDNDFSDFYVKDTLYSAYLYVNSGSIDGSYGIEQGKKLYIDNSQLIGSDKDNSFEKVKDEERQKYIKTIAGEEANQNYFLLPKFDTVFLKFIFIFVMIVKALILGLPILFIYFLSFISQLAFLVLEVAMPFCLLLSFLPMFRNFLFDCLKTMLGASITPTFGSMLFIMVILINTVISNALSEKVNDVLTNSVFNSFAPVLNLAISTVVSCLVYLFFWKMRYRIVELFLGAKAIPEMSLSVADKAIDKVLPDKSSQYLGQHDIPMENRLPKEYSNNGMHNSYDEVDTHYQNSVATDDTDNMNSDLDNAFSEDTLDDNAVDSDLFNSYDEVDISDNVIDDTDKMEETPYDEIEPTYEADNFDYDSIHQENVSDGLESETDKEVSVKDFEEDVMLEETTDYQKKADNHQSQPVFENSNGNLSMDSPIEEVEVSSLDSSPISANDLSADYRKQADKLTNDNSSLKRSFKMEYIQKELERLRGE